MTKQSQENGDCHTPTFVGARNDILNGLYICHCERSEAISMDRQFYVYIMTNKNNSVLYTGITNDLKKRIYEHKEKLVDGFTNKYNITKLVYYEVFEDPENAI